MAGLTYLSIIGSRNTAERVRDLVWSYTTWMALRRWEDDTPGVTAMAEVHCNLYKSSQEAAGRCMRRREQNEYNAFHLIQFSSAANTNSWS
jgi:hypothetical protein